MKIFLWKTTLKKSGVNSWLFLRKKKFIALLHLNMIKTKVSFWVVFVTMLLSHINELSRKIEQLVASGNESSHYDQH